MVTAVLTDEQAAVLDFERSWFKYQGAKEQAIRERFGWSATKYYAVLNALLEVPAAMEYAPMVVRRLRRLRDKRAAGRVGRVGTLQ